MNLQTSSISSLQQAIAILQKYSSTDSMDCHPQDEVTQLQQAILAVSTAADYVNLGICAPTYAQADIAMKSYLNALSYPLPSGSQAHLSNPPEPIYIKYNGRNQSIYCQPYSGDYEGVLVSCQSESDLLNGTYGHFPLTLFTGN
ncbi:MAG: DUF1824 family protein [Cyanobacteria bacterium P01_H01_bin.15]